MGWLRVALCQIDAVVGDFDGNVRRVLDASSRAERLGADVAVFPELVLTGYPPEDLLLEPDFVAASERALAAVAARSAGCAVVVGYVAESGGLRNSAAVCRRGEVRGVAVKELLPNYGVFDEQRWFVPGAGDSPVFRIGGGPVGVVICEDAWAPSGPVARLAAAGAGIVLSLNASPYRARARAERREVLVARACGESGCPIVYVNLVGGQDELVFDGDSTVVAADGSLLACLAQFREEVAVVDVPFADDARGEPRRGVVEVSGRREGRTRQRGRDDRRGPRRRRRDLRGPRAGDAGLRREERLPRLRRRAVGWDRLVARRHDRRRRGGGPPGARRGDAVALLLHRFARRREPPSREASASISP